MLKNIKKTEHPCCERSVSNACKNADLYVITFVPYFQN